MTAVQSVLWGSSRFYRGRAHLVVEGARVSLCGVPIDRVAPDRGDARTCPECALGYVEATIAPRRPHW